ncbi:L-threonylcarbamoyladenylate synthase [Candidatus Peregrinibacteria bacterium]|nr:L-threonylcarbamoyladenylate synthase [Candidatus Peregrinibacteria bacterium]
MNILEISEAALMHAMHILQTGGIVAHATETCYGFACDLANEQAVEKLFALKKRPTDQPVSALFASIENAKRYVEWNEEAEKLAKKYLPGPLTLILPFRSGARTIYPIAPSQFAICNSQIRTVGIRISSHPLAQELVSRFGSFMQNSSMDSTGQAPRASMPAPQGKKLFTEMGAGLRPAFPRPFASPLSTTSANLHGQPNSYSAEEIVKQFEDQKLQPDLILDSGLLPIIPPSTILDLTRPNVRTVRKGTL